MLSHRVETCPGDLAALRDRLDAIAGEGARIIAVVWQPQRVEEQDQSNAFDAQGSFVIVAEDRLEDPLRVREPRMAEAMPEVAPLS